MANFDLIERNGITGTGLAGAVDVQEVANGMGLTLSGTFVASVQVLLSFDGVAFVPFEAVKTVAGYYAIPPCHSVDLDCTAFTSGQVDWQLGGLRSV